MKSPVFMKELIKSIQSTFESSSIHAIPNIIIRKSFILKLFWFISLILSTGCCFWFMTDSINDYFQYDVVTKIDIKYQNELVFPIIGICNQNPFKKNLSLFEDQSIGLNYNFNRSDLPLIIMKHKINNSEETSYKYSQNLNDFMIKCLFRGKNCDLNKDFEYYYDIQYGNCFRFNSKKPYKKVNQPSSYDLFEIQILVGSSNHNLNTVTLDNGFNIFISNESTDSTIQEGVSIPTGFTTKIILNKYTIRKQPKPYSQCTNNLFNIDSYNSDCYKRTIQGLKGHSSYHYTDCLKMCYQTYLARSCNCQTIYYDLLYNETLPKCQVTESNYQKDFSCEAEIWKKLISSLDLINECDCPFECEKTGYTYSSSLSDFPTKGYYLHLLKNEPLIREKMSNNISYEEFRQSVARVIIFYDELKDTLISEEIKTKPGDLVSNIGGTLGLFLGNYHLNLNPINKVNFKLYIYN